MSKKKKKITLLIFLALGFKCDVNNHAHNLHRFSKGMNHSAIILSWIEEFVSEPKYLAVPAVK